MSSDGKSEYPLGSISVPVAKESPLLIDTSHKIRNLYLNTLQNKGAARIPQRTAERQQVWESILADTGGVRYGDAIREFKKALEIAIPMRKDGPTTLFTEFTDPFVRELLTDLLYANTHIEALKKGQSTNTSDESTLQVNSQEFTKSLLKKYSGRASRDLFLKYFNIDEAIKKYLQDPQDFGLSSQP